MLRKIELMYSFFGIDHKKRQCKECSHFHRYMYRDKYYRKCDVYGETNSEASDWAAKYRACGAFNQEYKGEAIINYVKRSCGEKLQEEPIEGQIMFEGGMTMRLIDAEALLEQAFDADTRVGRVRVVEVGSIKSAPTIEAKPVVYCKDCKYNVANSKHEPLDITDYTDITCEYFMTDGMSPNDYCSQGVKIPVISMEDVPKLAKD